VSTYLESAKADSDFKIGREWSNGPHRNGFKAFPAPFITRKKANGYRKNAITFRLPGGKGTLKDLGNDAIGAACSAVKKSTFS
jgi:hypothetical protein